MPCWPSGRKGTHRDTFAALTAENSADEATKDNGGLNEDANRDSLETSVKEWLFSTDRKEGDTTVVETTDSSRQRGGLPDSLPGELWSDPLGVSGHQRPALGRL